MIIFTINDCIFDIKALEESLSQFEQKYHMKSEDILLMYDNGYEPPDEISILDYGECASLYRILLRRKAEYSNMIKKE